MADQIKIRAHLQADYAELRVLLQHPMETGQRKDEKGQIVPAHFIQTFSITVNGKALIDGQLNTSIAKNPLFGFRTRGIKAGDRLAVSWQDNKGEQRSDEIVVA